HTRFSRDWSSDVCSSDLFARPGGSPLGGPLVRRGWGATVQNRRFLLVRSIRGRCFLGSGLLNRDGRGGCRRGSSAADNGVSRGRSEERRVGKGGRAGVRT